MRWVTASDFVYGGDAPCGNFESTPSTLPSNSPYVSVFELLSTTWLLARITRQKDRNFIDKKYKLLTTCVFLNKYLWQTRKQE